MFKPKFLTKAQASDAGSTPRISHAGSCSSLPGPDQSSCSTSSADGAVRFLSCSGVCSSAAMPGRDANCVVDRACAMPAGGYMAQLAAEAVHSSGCNVIHSGPLFQAAATYEQQQQGGRPGQACNSSSGLLAPQQHVFTGLSSGAMGNSAPQLGPQQGWLHQWQMANGAQQGPAGARLDEPCAGPAGGANFSARSYLANFRPLHDPCTPDGAAMAAPMYAASMTPTSLAILAGGQEEGLSRFGGGPAVLPLGPYLCDDTAFGSGMMNPAAFEVVTTLPAVPIAGDSMGLLPFGNSNECFSTYSNFLDGHPSMQLAQVRAGVSGHLPGLPLVSSSCLADAAAAADCSASLLNSGAFASGGYVGCALPHMGQQQQQMQPQHPQQRGAHHSGSNLQLTTGALYRAAGGTWDGADELAELQRAQVMTLDDSGYFDLYKSGSSLDSLKADDTMTTTATGNSSYSFANKVSSCSSTDTRHSGVSSNAAAVALARQQQDQLLTLQEQRKMQLAGMGGPPAQSGLQHMVPAMGTAGGLFGRPSSAAGHWPLPQRHQQQQQSVVGSLGLGGGQTDSGSVLPLSGSICSGSHAEEGLVSVQLQAGPGAVALVAPHLESINAMSKAIVAIESHGHQVSFKVLGLPSQVQLATNMVHLLLQKEQQG